MAALSKKMSIAFGRDFQRRVVVAALLSFLLSASHGGCVVEELSARGSAGSFLKSMKAMHTILAKESMQAHIQEEAAKGVLHRLIPEHDGSFEFSIISKEDCDNVACFIIDNIANKEEANPSITPQVLQPAIKIRGTSGVELCAGLHWYLKKICGGHISWDKTGGNNFKLVPRPGHLPPLPNGGIKIMRAVPWSYYQNVVTYSYSFAWWSWERWEREIDWMALQGINLPLAFTGQETIWQKVFQKPDYNLTKEDLDAHFGGPAFLAWARMGNLHGWGGPLPQAWLDQQLEMQKRILARMRSLGMTPVLPAFAGHVPDALIAKFPSANITKTENWNTVNGDQRWCCTALLDPTDPLFRKIGESFLLEQIKEYGTNHIYNCDSFNENLPPTSEPSFISELGGAVFRAMLAADRDAIWLMQGWLFQSEAFFWKEPQMKALLHSVPLGRMLVLDLFAEVKPVWNRTNHFYGVPYIWCMLHNFGGNHEMYGTLESIASGPVAARTSTDSTMVGIGMAMEGIEHNPIVYDLMPEMAFHAEPLSVQEWVDDYVKRRYGGENYAAKEAWKILVATLYNCTDGIADHNGDVIVDPKDVPIPTSLYWHNRKTHRRALHGTRTDYETRKSGWENEEKGTAYERLLEGEGPMVGRAVHQWYDEEKVFHAAELLLSASTDYGDMETYRYDLVDVTRQVISKATNRLYGEMIDAFLKGDSEDVAKLGQSIVGAMADLDRLLATHEGFLLGPWLEGAKSFAKTEEEAALYEWNARTQITMWYDTTPTQPSSLHDYANKMWSGLLKNYYLPRMALFVSLLRNAARAKKPFPVTEWQRNWVAFSRRWQAGRELHSTAAEGDSMRLVTVLLKKYLPLAGNGSSGLAKSPNMGLQVSWS